MEKCTMTVKIAFCGAGGTGKSTLSKYVNDWFLSESMYGRDLHGEWSIRLGSATRKIVDYTGWDVETTHNDQLQLYSQIQRRLWMYENKDKNVISERCGLDEIVYQKYRIDQLTEKQASTQILSPNGQPQVTDTMAQLHIGSAYFQVLIQEGLDEVDNYWNFIYYCSPYGQIEDDGLRPTDQDYQFEIVKGYSWLFDQFKHITPKIVELPNDLDEAQSVLDKEKERWREFHDDSQTS